LEGLTLGITTLLTDIPTFKEILLGNSQAKFFDGSENLCVILLPELYRKKILKENKTS
jgi:hypothetical protein